MTPEEEDRQRAEAIKSGEQVARMRERMHRDLMAAADLAAREDVEQQAKYRQEQFTIDERQREVAMKYGKVAAKRDQYYGGRVLFVRALVVAGWLGGIAWAFDAKSLTPFVYSFLLHVAGSIYVVICDISAGIHDDNK